MKLKDHRKLSKGDVDMRVVRPVPIATPEHPALRRIRFWGKLLDTCIVLPGGFRIGIDPLIGLLPGAGDFIATLLSCFPVFEAYRLGIPKRVIGLMLINIATEGIVGTVPVLGDLFDAVWKANIRNLRLVEEAYHPGLKPRSIERLLLFVVLISASVIFLVAMAILGLVRGIESLF